jgi:hypothetical protein
VNLGLPSKKLSGWPTPGARGIAAGAGPKWHTKHGRAPTAYQAMPSPSALAIERDLT